ncbi:hypothetical protein A6U87_06880 [Rhizobium sp. AC44/96]|nr:hypothetical protein A6U87_06880 [Rhizobium sp. AC44/96]
MEIGGVRNILIRVDRPKGSLVVLTGGDGVLAVDSRGKFTGNASSVLIRNRDAFAASGFDVLLVEKGTSLADAVRHMEALKRPVTIVATSAGTPRAAEGLRAGARPDRLILTSGFLSRKSGPGSSVANILGSPAALPSTLVIHHRQDGCRFTSPAGVAPFIAWSKGRAKVEWLSGGTENDKPCRFDAHHGFAGQDAELVARIVGFASP